MRRVGLTGGVASGKSTVSAILDELGAVIIDADVLAREVVAAGTDGLREVVEAFGPDVLTDSWYWSFTTRDARSGSSTSWRSLTGASAGS